MATVWIGSDHAGYPLKQELLKLSQARDWMDVGVHSSQPADYPDIADLIAKNMSVAPVESRAILICGSGQGMCMRANRYSFLRAALCLSPEQAILTREHNDANVLCLPGRLLTPILAAHIVNAFLTTAFAGGRHLGRVQKLSAPLIVKGKS